MMLPKSANFSKKNSPQNQVIPVKNGYSQDTVSFGSSNPLYLINQAAKSQIEPLNSNFLKFAKIRLNFKDYEIPVHNAKIASFMDESYTAKSFKKLFNHADSNGVFDFKVNEATGYIKTSDIPSVHDARMADNTWGTDACRTISLLEEKRPELVTKVTESLSGFYKAEEPEFEKVIANPNIFNSHNGWGDGGVGHVFNAQTNISDRNYPRTRLETIGQELQRFTQLVVDGLVNNKKSGYKNAASISDNSIDTFANCVKYLKVLNYPQARSCGAWEERTFNTSLTSDTSIINEGFRRAINLMSENTSNPEILKLRERVLNSKNGDVFKDINEIKELLKHGEERVIFNHFEEAPGDRKLDASLSFISHYKDGKLTASNIVLDDIKEHIKVLEMLEGPEGSNGLVGENGIARYLGDDYKNLNRDRAGRRDENHEAQWFMVSDMSKGYGVQLEKLIDSIKNENRIPVDEEKALMEKLLKKETEYINRSFARITGENAIKANGEACAPYKVPEAYQAITNEKDKVVFVPGTNTPLAWAQASLLDASNVFKENLGALEQLGWLNQRQGINLVA